jgi:hypothetical protein
MDQPERKHTNSDRRKGQRQHEKVKNEKKEGKKHHRRSRSEEKKPKKDKKRSDGTTKKRRSPHRPSLADKNVQFHRTTRDKFDIVTKRHYNSDDEEISRSVSWTGSYSVSADADFDFEIPTWKELNERLEKAKTKREKESKNRK